MNHDYRLLVSIRSASRPIARLIALMLVVLTLPLSPVSATAANEAIEVRLVAQNFNVATTRQLRFVLNIADEQAREVLANDPTARVNVAVGNALTSRAQVLDIAERGTELDRVAETSLRIRQLDRNEVGDFVVQSSLIGNLRRLAGGVHPVTVELLRDDAVVGSVTSFINVFTETEQFAALPVSMVASIDATNSFTPQGAVQLNTQTRTQLETLAGLVELGPTPLSVQIAPHVLEALTRSTDPANAALRDRLVAALPRHENLPTTFVPFDPSSASRSSLVEAFTEQLQFGEASIDRYNGDAPLDRTVWFSRVPVDRDGVSLTRQLGFQTLVLAPQAATRVGALDNYAKPYRVDGSTGGSSMVLRTVDPVHGRLLSTQTGDQLVTAYTIAADLLVGRQEILDGGGDPTTRHAVLASNSGSPPAAGIAAPLLIALSRAPQLSLQSLASGSVSLSGTSTVSLPRADRVSLLDRRESLQSMFDQIASTSSMLTPDAPQHEAWRISRLSCGHDSLSTEEFQLCVRGLRGQLRALRNQVSIPESLTFTLGGRESDLRLQVRNESTQTLSVVVSMNSAKLQFPEGSQLVSIPPTSSMDLLFPVRARANGRFPVEVVLTTPDGLTQVGRRVPMTARVSALAGLGQVVTGASIIILLTWWVSHWRKKRREQASQNHPALH
jgi:hypothetical protein